MPQNVVLWKWLEDVLDWFKDLLLWWPRKIWELLTDALAGFIESIPVPDFFTNLGSYAAGLDPAIGYFLAPMQLGVGLGLVISAYVIRFAIRRIPLIG